MGRIWVRVKPNKNEQKIIKISDEELEVWLRSEPKNNKANEELVVLLSKYYHINQKDIRILRGHRSRLKLLEIKK